MSKYCPKCMGEFNDSIKICPNDNVNLQKKKPTDEFSQFIDIYVAQDEIEAERIVTFLKGDGIDARESVLGISQIPVSGHGRNKISVPKESEKKAREKIDMAIKDGVISNNGEFIGA